MLMAKPALKWSLSPGSRHKCEVVDERRTDELTAGDHHEAMLTHVHLDSIPSISVAYNDPHFSAHDGLRA
ncbi:hypothetical protein MOKP4_48480 [Mycobacterium avium subsp. hominissuis]|uniref:Uncharacterized protein n=4 Tax=Mycobacteriaceae TaxID=1762 RepID=A0AAI8X115_MYCAV|nr:hypothetical protein ABW17_25430 [Mycobacterium nebraskense]KRQ37577.1 hypothetical protein AOT92_21145 [Mycobacteroides sp. H101]OBS02897.1 hypothetical protein A9W98_12400 [Mycobacterium gordonae]ORV96912.1 hypothetical protein AWC13_18145 [Mycobacterium kubicae]BBN46275.1 hypothetical protein JPH1_07500 [Mycobacterium avium subsp. hominissuis]